MWLPFKFRHGTGGEKQQTVGATVIKKDGDQGFLSVVLELDPCYPAGAVRELLGYLTTDGVRASVTVHGHSSLRSPLAEELKNWLPVLEGKRTENHLNMVVIWKSVGKDPVLKIVNRPGFKDVLGEASIARFLARCLESWTPVVLYEKLGSSKVAEIDAWIDSVQDTQPAALSKKIHQALEKSEWLVAGTKTLADIFLCGAHF